MITEYFIDYKIYTMYIYVLLLSAYDECLKETGRFLDAEIGQIDLPVTPSS